MIPKENATSTVEQYNREISFGDEYGGFFDEGGTPEDTDSEYQRVAEFVKYLGTIRGVTLQAKMTNMSVGSIKQKAIQDGMKNILRRADRALFNGNAKVIDQEWNGILTQHQNYFTSFAEWYASPTVIDLRGKALDEAVLEDAAQVIDDNNGYSDTLLAHTSVISNFSKRFYNSKFFRPNTPEVSAAEVGQAVSKVHNSYSSIALEKDKFMNDQVARTLLDNATSPKAPPVPVADGAAPAVAVSDTSGFFSGFNGDYVIAVAAENQFGLSPLVQLGNAAVSIAADESVDLKFTAGVGAYSTKGYVIYMSEKDSTNGNLYPVLRISTTEHAAGFDGGIQGVVRNRNRIIPNTQKAMQFENNNDVWGFKQLGSMMKMPLALTSTTERDMILLFGTPMLYLPSKMVVFINCGKYVQVT
jgi:hypothetical protein